MKTLAFELSQKKGLGEMYDWRLFKVELMSDYHFCQPFYNGKLDQKFGTMKSN